MSYLGRDAGDWITDLGSRDPLRRRLAAYALGEDGDEAARAALRGALDDEQAFVRVWAAAALARVAPGDPAVLPVLAAGLADPQAFVRSLSAWHLGRLGAAYPEVASVRPALEVATGDDDANVRVEAALALRRCTTKRRMRAAG